VDDYYFVSPPACLLSLGQTTKTSLVFPSSCKRKSNGLKRSRDEQMRGEHKGKEHSRSSSSSHMQTPNCIG